MKKCVILFLVMLNALLLFAPPPPPPPPRPPKPQVERLVNVKIYSNPRNAYVTIDGRNYGRTPLVVRLRYGSTYNISFNRSNYESVSISYRCNGSAINVGLNPIYREPVRKYKPKRRQAEPEPEPESPPPPPPPPPPPGPPR